jgi:Na+/H+-dicarboxylate symporter
VAKYNLEETKILLRQVWAFMLMSLYGIGIFQERWLSLQTEAVQPAESIFPNLAKVIFFGLVFVSFLIDIVEMREDRDKAYQFLFLSLIAGGLSATISAAQYQVLVNVLG